MEGSKMTVVKLEQNDPSGIIKMFEELTERARAGEFLTAVAVCLKPGNGYTVDFSGGYRSGMELISACECAKVSLLRDMMNL
jgi:hypothetical protein